MSLMADLLNHLARSNNKLLPCVEVNGALKAAGATAEIQKAARLDGVRVCVCVALGVGGRGIAEAAP